MKIYDLDLNPLTQGSLTVPPGTTKDISVMIHSDRLGEHLSCAAVADCVIQAKHIGAVSFTNIESSSLDLTAYFGLTEEFVIRITASAGIYGQRLAEISAA
jgi:hypothetical protein